MVTITRSSHALFSFVNNNTIVIDCSMVDIEINSVASWSAFPRIEETTHFLHRDVNEDEDDHTNVVA